MNNYEKLYLSDLDITALGSNKKINYLIDYYELPINNITIKIY